MKIEKLVNLLDGRVDKRAIPHIIDMVKNNEEHMIKYLEENKNLTLTQILLKTQQIKK